MLNENVEAVAFRLFAANHWELRDEVPHFAFEAHVGNEALVAGRINARQVAGIGITVRVAIGDVKHDEDVVTAADNGAGHE